MNIAITDKAAVEIKRSFTENTSEAGEKMYLRLRILGGGCSGWSHKLDITSEINDKSDDTFISNGIDMVVDKRSALYTDGVVIDFIQDLNKRGFDIKNPAARSTCGCSMSFSM